MQIEHARQTSISDFEHFTNWKNNRQKICFWKFSNIFLELPETEYMYNNTCWWICVQNFKSGYIEKRLSLTVLNAQKATFYAISEDLGIFPILNFCPIWTV